MKQRSTRFGRAPLALIGLLLTAAPARAQTTPPDLIVSGPVTIPGGTYHDITITPDGDARLGGNVTVTGTLRLAGLLNDGCAIIDGPGDFEMTPYARLVICSAEGLSAIGPRGTVQVTGRRGFLGRAFYTYAAPGAQQTGDGLPAEVYILIADSRGDLTLTQPVAVRLELIVSGTGNVLSNGHLLLRSAADTSAMLLNINVNGGRVIGPMTMQRAVSSTTRNPGAGYRHFASPMLSSTVADLTTAGFSPTVNAAYNTSATPGAVTPFPTVFGYDESRVLTSPATTYSPFDRGWVSPASLADALTPGRAYTVHLPATAVVSFTGTPRTGDLTVPLTRTSGPDGGWQLLGNPYPGPIDLRQFAPADLQGLDQALYVYETTGAYMGQYRSYVNGMPGGFQASRVAACQGFFMRVSDGQTRGQITFRNIQRVSSTVYDEQPFGRAATPDRRPQLHLALSGAGRTDTAYVYAQLGATPAADAAYDARKLLNASGLNLATLAAGGEALAINGLPAFSAATVVPLQLTIPAASTYTLQAARLLHLPAGLQAELLDAATGQRWNLRQPVPAFQLPTGPTTRFSLVFRPAGVTTTAPTLTAVQVLVAPNPAHDAVMVQLPAATGATPTVAVLNALGQVVLPARPLLVRGGEARAILPLTELAPGTYLLRLTAGNTVLSKRLVVE